MTASDKLVDFATSKLNDAINVVEKVLPTATKYVLQITSLNCLMNLTQLIVLIPLLIFLSLLSRYLFIKIQNGKTYDKPFVFGIWGVVSLIVLGVLTIAIFQILTDGWNWVCIFRPDLYLVHLAVQKVLGQ